MIEYVNAFYFLSARRTIGFSCENPISVNEIMAYLRIYPTDDLELFMYLISEMDSEYLRCKYSDKPRVENTDGG